MLETVQSNNLKFNPDKIPFKTKECKSFGKLPTPEDMNIDQKKVKAIMKIDALQSKKELESFQGMVNCLKQYSSRLMHMAEPLKELLRNDTLWCWESKYQEAFEAIKEELTKTLVLAYFDPKVDHIIQVYVSMKVLGAFLLEKVRPVICVSRTLMLLEIGYSNIKRELLSLIFGLERLHHYICGIVEVQTDHKPLIPFWKKSIVASSHQLQWLLL